jgi:hypothetical protein
MKSLFIKLTGALVLLALAALFAFSGSFASVPVAAATTPPLEPILGPAGRILWTLAQQINVLEKTVSSFAESFTTQTLTATTGNFRTLCVGTTCVTPQQFQAMVAAAQPGQTSSSLPESVTQNSASIATTVQIGDPTTTISGASSSTPATITINGANPAVIEVGAAYNDLGATITGPEQDLNLGITTYVNGVQMSPIQIDTSSAATDTIDYVATDSFGNTATSTRTVIIEAEAVTPATSPAAASASSTAATSTGE